MPATKRKTTIKLNSSTKLRLDHLKIYQRETYDDILKKILEILNVCRSSPASAQQRLIKLDEDRKRNLSGIKK